MKSIIPVIHLPPLPGSLRASKDSFEALQLAGRQALNEAKIFEQKGFKTVIVENFGDVPFFKSKVPLETVSAMSIIVAAIRESTRLEVGVNILRNDALSALTVAAVTGSSFIRVNVLSGVYATDQGLIEGVAAELGREKKRLAPQVKLFADVFVKHAKSISQDDLELAMEETALRAGADCLVISGTTTGRAPDLEFVEKASKIAKNLNTPLFIGSGANEKNAKDFLSLCDGIIVSSCFRRGNKPGNPLVPKQIDQFLKALKGKPVQKKGIRKTKKR